MVRIINYVKRETEDKTFFVLELQGGIEMTMSQSSGRYYATAKKAFISSTFDEETCKALVGTQMEGSIKKEECEPYEYTIKDTGEIIILTHTYVFIPEVVQSQEFPAEKPGASLIPKDYTLSQNGVLETELAI